MCSRCVRTVARESPSTPAASLFERPFAINRRISISRSVNGRIGGSSRYAGGGRVSVSATGKRRSSLRARLGWMWGPPAFPSAAGSRALPRRAALEETPGAARLHGVDHLLLFVEDGEDEDLDRRPLPLHL